MTAPDEAGRGRGNPPREAELSGVLIPAVTPFDPVTGELDVVALRANVRSWLETPVRGIVIAGSTGEAVLLDEDERRTAIAAARDVIPHDRILVAGTGAESTRRTVRLTRAAALAGADAVLVQPPAFFRDAMDGRALGDHYRTVADESTVPVILYQVPLKFSTVELTTGLVAELSEHPRVIGVKDSRGDLEALGEYLTHVSRDFQVLIGDGAKLYAALEMGAAGGILGAANLVAGELAEIVRAFEAGRPGEAGRIQELVAPVHTEIVARYGAPGVKAALDLLGLRGGEPRPPLRAPGEKTRGKIRATLERAALLA